MEREKEKKERKRGYMEEEDDVTVCHRCIGVDVADVDRRGRGR